MSASAHNGGLHLEFGPAQIVMLLLDLLLLEVGKEVLEFYIAQPIQEMRLFS